MKKLRDTKTSYGSITLNIAGFKREHKLIKGVIMVLDGNFT